METYKIEKNIPRMVINGNTKRLPFTEMQIGDSIFVPVGDACTNSLRQYTTMTKKITGAIFELQQQPGGTRIWRVG